MIKKIGIFAGGTAGHIEPALNVADYISSNSSKYEIEFFGNSNSMEERLIKNRGYKFNEISAFPFPRKPNLELLKFPLRFYKSLKVSRKSIKNNSIDIVIGFGGYVSLPGYIAGKLFRKKNRKFIVLHEANLKMGLANLIGKKFADLVFSSHELDKNAIISGTPLKNKILQIDFSKKEVLKKSYNLNLDNPVLFVFGGSQGAQKINELISKNYEEFFKNKITVIHVFGEKNIIPEHVFKNENYLALPFASKMEDFYEISDLILARSGMLTVAEIGFLGLPAVFIPLNHGNGEQKINANDLVEKGQAVVINEVEINSEWVKNYLIPLIKDKEKLNKMRFEKLNMSKQSAAKIILDKIEKNYCGSKTR